MNPAAFAPTCSRSPAGEGDGVVTYGELFTVQPFGNSLVTMTLTGAQIDRMLEEQFCGLNSPNTTPTPGFFKVLLPSAGIHYTWDQSEAGAVNCDTANAVDAGWHHHRWLAARPRAHLPRHGQQLPR